MSDELPQTALSERRIAIVGGGLAGIAAAAELSRVGCAVTVYEARTRLGGRATSFDDKQSGDLVDNCQHVGMGCCTNLQKFCDDFGIADSFRVESKLYFIDRRGRVSQFAATKLPAPFHLASAFAGLQYLSWLEKYELARGLGQLAAEKRFDGPFLTWLIYAGQGERLRRLFWHVVLVSALSDTLDRVSTQVARKVFVDGFLKNRNAWEVHLPTAPLDKLYGSPITAALTARGVELKLNTAVATVRKTSTHWTVATRDGATAEYAAVVLAVPHHRVSGLVDDDVAALPQIANAEQLEPAPIASVHLWFDRPITDLPHAVFVEHLSQWMFQRPSSESQLAYYQVVISASHDLEGRDRDGIIAEVCSDLGTAFPVLREASLKHSRVVVEKRAVFSPTPESHRFRSSNRAGLSGLYLAGDWTDTGWPATMEGAVRSGYLAAESVLRDAGEQHSLVARDLPSSLASRILRW